MAVNSFCYLSRAEPVLSLHMNLFARRKNIRSKEIRKYKKKQSEPLEMKTSNKYEMQNSMNFAFRLHQWDLMSIPPPGSNREKKKKNIMKK